MNISIIIPIYNEESTILPLHQKIQNAMKDLDYEIIFIDDGSTDNTLNKIREIKDSRLKVIHFNKNKGRCLAFYAGFKQANGDIIGTLDADMQDDPRDIRLMIEELKKGYDFVCGWRYKRKDKLSKKLFSKFANFAQNILLRINFHDANCPVKVFRKECLSKVKYFKHYHRFFTAIIYLQGFKSRESRVRHYPRLHGTSKYGIWDRLWPNIEIFLTLKFRYKKLIK